MKKLKNITVVGRQGGEEVAALKMRAIILVPVVFERYEQWDEGIRTAKNRIGERSPSCCAEVPKENGLYLCDCGHHIASIADRTDGVTMVICRQIVEILSAEPILEFCKRRKGRSR